MSLPQVRGNLPAMRELYNSHAHLYNQDQSGKRALKWEKLWDTTNRDYGKFAILRGGHFNKNKQDLAVVAKTPAKDQLYSRHLSSASVDVFKMEEPPKSPLKSEAITEKKSSLKSQSMIGDDSKLFPQNSNGNKFVFAKTRPGAKVMPIPSLKEHTKDFTRGLSSVDRSRPNRTSGYAKRYVSSTQGPFWDNIQNTCA